MNLLNIRQKANLLAFKNAQKIVPVYIFVELVLLAVSVVSNQWISILLSVILATITHTYVVTSLKIVEEKSVESKDAFIGFIGYGRLFPSYFMRKVMINLISILLLVPSILVIQTQNGFVIADLIDWVHLVIVSGIEDFSMIPVLYEYYTTPILLFSLFWASVIATIVSYGLAMVPYLVEKQDVSWLEAITKSWKMMRGHKRELFYLRLSYFPQVIMITLVTELVASLLSFNLYIATFGSLVLSLYLPILFYQPHFEIANALFYKELINQEEHPDLFVL